MTDVSINVSRDDIEKLVRLLGERPGGRPAFVSLDSTTVDTLYEEPATVSRATCAIADLRADDELDPGDHPELFEVEWKSDNLTIVEPYETDDRDEDRKTAQRIVSYLTKTFDLQEAL